MCSLHPPDTAVKVHIPDGAIICHRWTCFGYCPRRASCPYLHDWDIQSAHLEGKPVIIIPAHKELVAVDIAVLMEAYAALISALEEEVTAVMSAPKVAPVVPAPKLDDGKFAPKVAAVISPLEEKATAIMSAPKVAPVVPAPKLDDGKFAPKVAAVISPLGEKATAIMSAPKVGDGKSAPKVAGPGSAPTVAHGPSQYVSPAKTKDGRTIASRELFTTGNWDTMKSKWERFGDDNLTQKQYDAIIVPHLEDLKNGIITREFLEQSPPGSSPDVTFPQFSRLPYDIRHQIWKIYLTERRHILRIGFRYDVEELGKNKFLKNVARPINGRLVPLNGIDPVWRICKELYAMALSTKEWRDWFKPAGEKNAKGISTNLKRDCLFLHVKHSDEYLFAIKAIPAREKFLIKEFAVPLKHLIQGEPDEIGKHISEMLPNIEKLCILAGDGDDDRRYTNDNTGPYAWWKIVRWHNRIWAEANKKRNEKADVMDKIFAEEAEKEGKKDVKKMKRRTTIPAIIKEWIPAHVAHYYRIDDYIFSSSSSQTLPWKLVLNL